MTNPELADLIIERLNEIAVYDKAAITRLIELRVPCNAQLADHPTVQVQDVAGNVCVGLLGMLNGIVGAIETEGSLKGYGFVAAEFDDDNNFVKFRRTDVQPVPNDLGTTLPDPEKRGRIPDEPE